MKDQLADIREKIRAGRFNNEAAVSQGIVRRILDELGWPVYDTDVVSPEYSLAGRRVDYALCHPPGKPIAFIEVKQPGHGLGADRQLFEYAFHRGIPMAILTDGQEWHFFLPAEQGDYGERRVYKLDILERDLDESVERLRRYLDYRAMSTGQAIEAARRDYRDIAKEREIKATLPEAWTKLISESDELLLELIADKTESLCGYKPSLDMVSSFLRESDNRPLRMPTTQTTRPPQVVHPPSTLPVRREYTPTAGPIGFTLDGQTYNAHNARDVMRQIFHQFAERDPTFLERFVALPKHGQKRRYLARSREELYPDRPDLARNYSAEFLPGWWIGLNYSKEHIEKIIRIACDVAGVRFGSQLEIRL